MILYKDKEGLGKRRDICEMERSGGERYAIAGGPGLLLIVGDLTEAARRQ